MDATPHQKIDPSLFLLCLTSSLPWLQITNWKKVSLIAFTKILPKILSVVHIFSFIITAYSKKFTGSKFLSTKQCSTELSSWIIPHVFPIYQKRITSFHLACCQYHVWTPTHVLFCEIFENFKNTYLEEHLWTTAPVRLKKISPLLVGAVQ